MRDGYARAADPPRLVALGPARRERRGTTGLALSKTKTKTLPRNQGPWGQGGWKDTDGLSQATGHMSETWHGREVVLPAARNRGSGYGLCAQPCGRPAPRHKTSHPPSWGCWASRRLAQTCRRRRPRARAGGFPWWCSSGRALPRPHPQSPPQKRLRGLPLTSPLGEQQ